MFVTLLLQTDRFDSTAFIKRSMNLLKPQMTAPQPARWHHPVYGWRCFIHRPKMLLFKHGRDWNFGLNLTERRKILISILVNMVLFRQIFYCLYVKLPRLIERHGLKWNLMALSCSISFTLRKYHLILFISLKTILYLLIYSLIPFNTV